MSTAPLYTKENPAPLAIGGAIDTSFVDRENDWFAVTLTAGVTYQFELVGAAAGLGHTLANTAGVAATLAIYDAQQWYVGGSTVYSGAPGTLPSLPFTPAASGTYHVVAAGYENGSYQLRASVKPNDDFGNSTASHGHVAINAGVDAQLGLPNDKDWFSVDLTAGILYQFILVDEAENPASDMLLKVVEPGTENLWWAGRPDVGGRLTLTGTPDESGRRYLEVSGTETTGKYRLSAYAIKDDYAANVAGSGRLAVNGTLNGRFEASHDRDWFEIVLEAGKSYQFGAVTTGGEIDGLMIYLRNPSSGSYQDARPVFTPLVSGKYYLEVQGRDAGTYAVSATRMSNDDFGNAAGANPGLLVVGQALNGRINYAGDVDYLRMAIKAGTIYEVTLSNSDAASAGLNDWAGDGERQYDYISLGQQGASTVFTFRARVNGEIDLSTYGAANSTFTVNARILGYDDHGAVYHTATKAAAGSTLAGRIETVGDVDAFTMSVTAGTSYLLKVDGELSSALKLSVGNPFYYSAPVALSTYTAAESGQIIIFASAGAVVGSYALTPTVTLNDWFVGSTMGKHFDGGAGFDTVSYTTPLRDSTVVRSGAGFVVTKFAASSDTLVSVERVLFSDGALAFDADGVAGAAYRLYRAAFDRTPDKGGVGYWISAMDKGASLNSVAQGFVASEEFKALYGAAPTNGEFVARLYMNVLDRAGEKAGVDYWVSVLDAGMSRASVLQGFSESAENIAAVATLIGNGFEYQPFG